MWDLISRHGPPPKDPRTVTFYLACPDRLTADFLAQYLERTADFTSSPPDPAISSEGQDYWDLHVTSYEATLSLGFLRQIGATVREAAKTFGCEIYAWDSVLKGAA
jgi:hypothetical protein